MIVILIIMMMTQVGNISSLFRYKEKGQIEEISNQLLGMIDEEKTNALLGKTQKTKISGTEQWKIVRKRSLDISLDTPRNTLSLLSRVNLADEKEDTYEADDIEKNWTLPLLTGAWYDCSLGNQGTKMVNGTNDINTVRIDFIGESLALSGGNGSAALSPLNTSHIVLKITSKSANQEIHIDKRTGLTYARPGLPNTVSCN